MKKLSYLLFFCLSLAFTSANSQNCQAQFMYFTSPGGSNSIQFIDSSWVNAGNPSYSWFFGDGNTSAMSSPMHTYAQAGTYGVCLTISTTLGCSSTFCDTIVVGNTSAPCNVSYTYTSGGGNLINFNNTSSTTGTQTYVWDFGDNNTSTGFNPSYTYSNPGIYGVTLTATTSTGATCSYFDTVYVNSCNASFGSQVSGTGMVNFTNFSAVSNQTYYAWDFGDGSPAANTRNASHTYTASGTYLVTLFLFDSLSNCNSTSIDSVNIAIAPPSACNASYRVELDTTTSFKVVLVNTSSYLQSHSYFWDFGDGTSAAGRTPVHQYQNFGSFLVCLTITDNQLNCTSTFCDTIGMDSTGALKSLGWGLQVKNPVSVGVEEVTSLEDFSIYPNPATDNITIEFGDNTKLVQVQLMDISGREIYSGQNQGNQLTQKIDLSGVKSGFYFVIIREGENKRVEKIIVNK